MRYLWNFLIALDVTLNALIGGNPRETISSRIGRAYRNLWVRKWIEDVPWPQWLKKHFLNSDDRK